MGNRYGVPDEIYNDHRFVDIGDLPTGFAPYKEYGVSKIFMRPLCVRELSLIHMGNNLGTEGVDHIIRAVNMTLSCDVNILTIGDFEYVMAWLRMQSYPKAPSLVRWECKKINIVEKEGRSFYEGADKDTLTVSEMELKGLMLETCNSKNTEIVHNTASDVHSLDDNDLYLPYDDIDFPRVSLLPEVMIETDKHPELRRQVEAVSWVKYGETLKEKTEYFLDQEIDFYWRIAECQKRYKHGITETLRLKCRVCGNSVTHIAKPNPVTFFADNSEKDILDIQYSLLSELNLQPCDNMPAKTLLYHHSCLAKDKQAEEERRRLQKAIGR